MFNTWKDVEGYNGRYKINKNGDILSIKDNKSIILKPSINRYGYYYLVLYKNGKPKTFRVHKLVALNFIKNPENKPIIDHINGNKLDNRVENLRWVTYKENTNNPNTYRDISGSRNPMINGHTFKTKKKISKTLKENPPRKSSVLCLNNNKIYNTIKDASEDLNICSQSISKVCRGITKTAGNKSFIYYNKG